MCLTAGRDTRSDLDPLLIIRHSAIIAHRRLPLWH
jgi:hypothetical protein